MNRHGWAVSPPSAEVPGRYCLKCASALRMLEWFVRCVECGEIVESESVAERRGWRFRADALGQLQPHCPACSSRLDGRR
jgi:predicted nucleic acid-binding Zn ribbon protein